MFKPSVYQQAFYDWITNGQGSAVIRAVAGSGKTTTLIQGLSLMGGRVFFGAYNKNIATEIQDRAPKRDGLFISTMHAAGFGMVRRAFPTVKVDDNKCRTIFRDAAARYPHYVPFEGAVLELVSLAKQAAFNVGGQTAKNEWNNLIDHFSIDCLGEDDLAINLARKVLAASISIDHQAVDYDDMIYSPLVHNMHTYTYDWVLVDEAQDTNAARRLLALKMLKRNGRLVAVGDEHQAIYGFTGADSNALQLIQTAVNAITLPLTVSYRCPKAVVAYAQRYVSHIQAADTAEEGEVLLCKQAELITKCQVGDAILSRFNAPLISQAFAFVAKGIAVRVEGREIGEGLKRLARRWKSKTFDALLKNLDQYEEREIAKAVQKEQTSKVTAIEDTVACLRVIIDRVVNLAAQPADAEGTPAELVCNEIDRIFGADVRKPCVLLSSIHKSKGREWHNVFWLQTGPSKRAVKDWELEQENNLCYVAVTRAQKTLTLVTLTKDEK